MSLRASDTCGDDSDRKLWDTARNLGGHVASKSDPTNDPAEFKPTQLACAMSLIEDLSLTAGADPVQNSTADGTSPKMLDVQKSPPIKMGFCFDMEPSSEDPSPGKENGRLKRGSIVSAFSFDHLQKALEGPTDVHCFELVDYDELHDVEGDGARTSLVSPETSSRPRRTRSFSFCDMDLDLDLFKPGDNEYAATSSETPPESLSPLDVARADLLQLDRSQQPGFESADANRLRLVGRPRVGGLLLCVVPKSWLPTLTRGSKCHFQWFRCFNSEPAQLVAGAKHAKYQILPGDVGCRLQLVAAPIEEDGSFGEALSVVSDYVTEGSASNVSSRYSSRDSSRASSPTRKTSSSTHFTVADAVRNNRRASTGGQGLKPTLKSSPSILPERSGSVQIMGEARMGQTLTVAASGDLCREPSGAPRKCKIQWLRGLKEQSGNYTFLKIPGAKTPKYTVGVHDLGCRLRVVAAPVLPDGSVGKAYTTHTDRIFA
ncbi:hypothetical protein CYMTET_55597 [Cymbomonas tetramitiformis]|uniref:AIR9-like A9 domain-containing protein n=1 Tax=Cymbomonas tetramitiformis TaxID=36881 RepID=A0AAE0BDW0_9CHLO|nr:hypothetical protein CYMTET_55597 [Cymbomonas tetramitiformis]